MTVYIHQRADWPKFTWRSSELADLLAAARHRQGRLLGKMEGLGFDLRGEASVAVLTAEVVKSSAIEGENLNPEEVRSSVARRLGVKTAGLPRAGREVEGVVAMTLDATRNFGDPLTRERLLGWHAGLFPTGHSGIAKIAVGAFRAGPMAAVSGAMGRERVHFEAPSAERLDAEVARFLEWFNAPPSLDPFLEAAIAHLWFVTIHPFDDGNGRIARAIAEAALASADGTRDRFYSMSTQIESERRGYYLQLESAQRGDLDITGWLEWFLGCLGRAIDAADRTLASVFRKAAFWQRIHRNPVNERQRRVLQRMLEDFEGFMTSSKYAKLAKCSTDTALRDLQDLVALRVLVRNKSGGRSTSYRLGEAKGSSAKS